MNYYCAKELEELRQFTNSKEEAITILDTGGFDGERDFEYNGFRFIHENDIDDTLEDELSSDTYILGCFNTSFLSDITGINQKVFDLCQENDAQEAIGELIITGNHLSELAKKYAQYDGYGHHFSHYDHSEHTVFINGNIYFVFNLEGLIVDEWEDEESQDSDINYSINKPNLEQGTHSVKIKSVDIVDNNINVNLSIDDTVKDPTTGELLDSNTLLPVDSVVDFTKIKFSDLF